MRDAASSAVVCSRRQHLQGWAALLGWAGLGPGGALAQGRGPWPQRPVDVVVPYPAGGISSRLAKTVANALGKHVPQPVRLAYRPGGAGAVGGQWVAHKEAHTERLLLGGSHLPIARALQPEGRFDFVLQLDPLLLLTRIPMVVLVQPARLKARYAPELLIELARKPARYRMATGGIGSASYLAAEMLRYYAKAQVEMLHFRGGGPAQQELLAGTADVMVDSLLAALPHIRSGRLKAVMLMGNQRDTTQPDVPCATELGLPELQMDNWYGLFARRGLPPAQRAQLMDRLMAMAKDPEFVAEWGVVWSGLQGEALQNLMLQDVRQWRERVQTLGLPTMPAEWGE